MSPSSQASTSARVSRAETTGAGPAGPARSVGSVGPGFSGRWPTAASGPATSRTPTSIAFAESLVMRSPVGTSSRTYFANLNRRQDSRPCGWTGGEADRRTGGEADRRTGGEAERRRGGELSEGVGQRSRRYSGSSRRNALSIGGTD